MTTNKHEIWKPIKGYEGKYEVSNKGKVRSLDYNGTGQIKFLPLNPNQNTGYIQVALYSTEMKHSINKYVHRLVAEAFLPNPKNLEQVDHVDGDKAHNSVSNIRWVSRKFNNSRKRAKLLKAQNRTNTSHLHQFVKASKEGQVVYFKNINIASKELGFSHVLGIKVIRGEFKTAKGWTLEYIERGSIEGKAANVDLRNKAQKRAVARKQRRMERKEHVRRLGLNAKNAHTIVGIDANGNRTIYPNTYQAEQKLGIGKIMDCLLGLRESSGGYKWTWLYN